jgi:hypothetical protein
MIVRADGPYHQKYVSGFGWVDSGVFLQYFNDESPVYELYEEITENEAKILIGGNAS